MSLNDRRLEHMRQITKGRVAEPSKQWVWVLEDSDSGCLIGIYSDEDLAWTACEELCMIYDIAADVKCMEVNADVIGFTNSIKNLA